MNINHWIVPGIFHWRWSPLCCGIKSTHHTQVALCCSPNAAGRWNLISSLMAKNKKWGFYGLLWTEAQWQVPLSRGRDFSAPPQLLLLAVYTVWWATGALGCRALAEQGWEMRQRLADWAGGWSYTQRTVQDYHLHSFPLGTVVISVGIQALWKCVHPLDREGEDPADPIPSTGSRGPPAEYLSSKPGSQAIKQPFPHLLLVPSRILMYVQLLFLTHTQRKKK